MTDGGVRLVSPGGAFVVVRPEKADTLRRMGFSDPMPAPRRAKRNEGAK